MIVAAALNNIEGKGANFIDKNKVIRERQKARMQNVESNNYANVATIYFDGRKDWNLVMKKLGTKRPRKDLSESLCQLNREANIWATLYHAVALSKI